MPPQMPASQMPGFPQQPPIYGAMPGQFPPQPVPQQAPLLPLPVVNINELRAITDPSERKNFVGNLIYPII